MPSLPPIIRLSDFSGGVNIRDSQTSLGPNELSQGFNISLDERGGISSRLGHSKWNITPFAAGLIQYLFYWGPSAYGALGHSYVQIGASLYQNTSTTPIHTFTTAARCAMADFAGKLCITHPVDGFFTWDTTTFTAVATGPKGNSMAVWQNKLWVNDATGANQSRVYFSEINDPTIWAGGGAGFNDIRENDNEQVVNVFGTASADIVGRPTLLIFKKRSTYRIIDSTTGTFQTLDSRVGTGGPMSVVALQNKIYSLSQDGIYQTDGTTPPMAVSDQLRPLWNVNQINVANLDLAAAGAYGKHAYFSFPKVGATANNLMLDLDVTAGSFTFNSNAMSCYARHLAPTVDVLLAGSPTVNGQLYQLLTSGTDDGANIVSMAQTRFTELNSGMEAVLNRARINGRGSCTVSPIYNYDWTTSITRSIALASSSATVHGSFQDIYNLGRAYSFGFRFDKLNNSKSSLWYW
jgi:hypothetical protein